MTFQNLQFLLKSTYIVGILTNFVVACCTLLKVAKVKNHKIKRQRDGREEVLSNTTYSKISVWMLYVSFSTVIVSLLLCIDFLYPLVDQSRPIRKTLVDGCHFYLFFMPMMNTLFQGYEWISMRDIVEEQKADCMELVMSNMENEEK